MNYLGPKVTGNFRGLQRRKRPKARDLREGMDPKHVKNIGKLSSCISGLKPCDAHHLKSEQAAKECGVSLRATDRRCVPLTRSEHAEIHRWGSKREVEWFRARGIDPHPLADELWANRDDVEEMERIVKEHYDRNRK